MNQDSIDYASLAEHYSDFKVRDRILLTGHSHQAWPNVAREGLLKSWEDASLHVDHKWGKAFEQADLVREGFRRMMGGISGDITLAQNTHDLLVRLLSALPWKERREILVTDGEFHTVRRQLTRLEEEGIQIRRIASQPTNSAGSRLAEAISEKTALIITSTVFFDSGQIAGGLPELAKAAQDKGALLLLDTYHHLNVVPFDPQGLETAFILGGGYKYCQFGEGNCFLRVPNDCSLRPVITGWFADYESLGGPPQATVSYGSYPGARFGGATYDPVSHYRAARVLQFFEDQQLSVERLRARSQKQIEILAHCFDGLKISERLISRDLRLPTAQIAGFLALKSPFAGELVTALQENEIWTDRRGDILRLGPAPYLTDDQLVQAVEILGTQLSRVSK